MCNLFKTVSDEKSEYRKDVLILYFRCAKMNVCNVGTIKINHKIKHCYGLSEVNLKLLHKQRFRNFLCNQLAVL